MGKHKRLPIGIDVGARAIKAVQLAPSAQSVTGWRVAAVTSLTRTSSGALLDADEVARLSDALDRQGFIGNHVVLAVPADKLFTTVLELPPRTGNVPLEQIARVELARAHKCAPDALEMGCWDLPAPARAAKGTHLMAVACSHADATPVLDNFESAGLNVVALDVRECAVARACAPALSNVAGIGAVLDIGWRSTNLLLVHHGVIVYGRVLADAGVGRLYDLLGSRLRLDEEVTDYLLAEVGLLTGPRRQDVTPEAFDLPADARGAIIAHFDAALEEVVAAFSYGVHQYSESSVGRVLLVGGGGAIPGLRDHFASVLRVPTQAAAPTDLVQCPDALLESCNSPALTAALGLAMFPEL